MLGPPQLDRCCTTDKSNAQHPVRGSQNPHGPDPFRLRAALAVGPISKITGTHAAVRVVGRRLLDDSLRAGVWPDSVQVIGGQLSKRLPTRGSVWLTSGLRPVGHR